MNRAGQELSNDIKIYEIRVKLKWNFIKLKSQFNWFSLKQLSTPIASRDPNGHKMKFIQMSWLLSLKIFNWKRKLTILIERDHLSVTQVNRKRVDAALPWQLTLTGPCQ